MSPISERLQAEIEADMTRALIFGQVLDSLFVETPAMQAVRQMGGQLQSERASLIAKPGKNAAARARILERDGTSCWLCGELLGEDATLEHLDPIALGGSSADSNLVLCHLECNRNLRALPKAAKIAARDALRTTARRMSI